MLRHLGGNRCCPWYGLCTCGLGLHIVGGFLVRRDDCCFGEAQHDDAVAAKEPYEKAMREYGMRVGSTLKKLGSGSFRLEIDETAPSHMISHYAIDRLILPTLAETRY